MREVPDDETIYFLWCSLRALLIKTKETVWSLPSFDVLFSLMTQIPWSTVAKAMGADVKPHTMYMRYWVCVSIIIIVN